MSCGGGRAELAARFRPKLDRFADTYKDNHQHPELSRQEMQTAERIISHLRSEEYEVHERVGGHGVVGVFRNEKGKTVLLRADMDALPIEEETQLPYASKVRMHDVLEDGAIGDSPVMHACGHDMHVATLMAAASALRASRAHWNGTLLCLFQPAKEGGGGAQAMVDDVL
ncbi:hypothetical protein CAC42_6665 [Sphaceloma murrayae]|uniref:Peptidase M20 dimerisation domain-containing protein n=1 Tax=Sphaceloma murrayae TaxID=2082308 RepID=A0A2K1QGX8_9PEZI|nr:hypothetical protein CAC42_6665 [Sphaceloma murrayae]